MICLVEPKQICITLIYFRHANSMRNSSSLLKLVVSASPHQPARLVSHRSFLAMLCMMQVVQPGGVVMLAQTNSICEANFQGDYVKGVEAWRTPTTHLVDQCVAKSAEVLTSINVSA